MAGDPLAPIKPGDPIEEAFRADRWNAVLAMARAWRASNGGNFIAGPPAPTPSPWTPSLVVHVRNTTGGTLPVFAVVSPSGAMADPESESFQAMREPVFAVSAPVTEDDPVFIVFDDADNNRIVRAVAEGITVARVDITDTMHKFARPIPGNLFQLQSAENGPVRLLQTFGATGVRKCYVMLGGLGSSVDSVSGGCGWPAALTKDDCLRVSVISGEGRCGCAEVSEEEVKLTSTDGERWGVDPEHIGTGSGCLLGVTLPDTGTVQAVFDIYFFASMEPLVSVGEQHWSTDGEGFWGESPIHLECVDGAWRMWQDLSSLELPDNEGTLVSQECRNTLGDPVATIIFDFATNYLDGSLCLGEGAPTPTGQMVFDFRIEDEAGCGEGGGPKLNICGTEYPVTFEKNCCGLPKLILTGFESAEACCGEDFADTVTVTVTKDDVTYTGEWSGDGTSYSWDLEPPGPTVYTTPGSHTFTPDATGDYLVECWGAGGGGADDVGGEDPRGGGGGGAYSAKTVALTASTGYSVAVGAGGAGGGMGGTGGDSTFDTTVVVAKGGVGGNGPFGGAGGAAGSGTGDTKFSGGAGSNTGFNAGGSGGGSSAGTGANGNSGSPPSGSTGGAGGAAVTEDGAGGNSGIAGANGSAPGGGGSGVGSTGPASGASGQVRITTA